MKNCLENQNFAIFGKDGFRLDNLLTRQILFLFGFYYVKKTGDVAFLTSEKKLKPCQSTVSLSSSLNPS